MNKLSNRLKYLACDVGERDRKLNPVKAQYLNESREYKNSQKRRANRNPFLAADRSPQLNIWNYMQGQMPPRHYQLPSNYNPLSMWPGRGGYPRDVTYPQPYGMPRRPAREMMASPWSMPPPPQKWKPRIPNRKPRKMRDIPEGEWAICWNFNSARGCPRGTSCPWRHQTYSTGASQTTTAETQGASNSQPFTIVGQSRRKVVQVQSRSQQDEAPEIENKNQEDGGAEATRKTSKSKIPVPVHWSPNVKGRDIDTDSKEERSPEKTPVRLKYGYNGGEPPESDSEESGVE